MGQSVHLDQMGVFQIIHADGADCFGFRIAASHSYPLAEPRFLKIAARGIVAKAAEVAKYLTQNRQFLTLRLRCALDDRHDDAIL